MALLAVVFLLGVSAPRACAAAADVEWAAAVPESEGELALRAAGLRDALTYLGDGDAPQSLLASAFLAAERPGFGDLPSRLSADLEVKRGFGAFVRRVHRAISSRRAFDRRRPLGAGLKNHALESLAARVVLLHRLPALLSFADDPDQARRQIESAYKMLGERSPNSLRLGEEAFWLAESRDKAAHVIQRTLQANLWPSLREPVVHFEGRTYPLRALSRHLKNAAPGERGEIRRVLEGSGMRLDLNAGRSRLFFEEPGHVEEFKDLILDGLLAQFLEHLGVDQLIVHHFDDRHLLQIEHFADGWNPAAAHFSLTDFTTGSPGPAVTARFRAADMPAGWARIVAQIDEPWVREHALPKLERLEGPGIGKLLRGAPFVFALAFLTAMDFHFDARAGDRLYFARPNLLASALALFSPGRLALAKRNMSLRGLADDGAGKILALENWRAGRLDGKWRQLLGALKVALDIGSDWGLTSGHELEDMIEGARVLEQTRGYVYDGHGVWRTPADATGEAGAVGR